ncbi:MAG TPA: alpha-ketoglutarate-dependent dioxygenase AlkB, partial [Amaricoccus sp.]|nr:alpha-ketoglutarate-dependent dioxygenase AlkB [Amaricoccus sp.]
NSPTARAARSSSRDMPWGWVLSGDVVVMGGAVRRAYHGVDRIRFGSSSLLDEGGRINLTLRVVD